MSDRPGAAPPRAAMVLGLSGLLPLAGAIVLLGLLRSGDDPPPGGFMIALPALGYAALILSFLGGMWWSAACLRLDGAALWRWLALAVAPSLWAAASFLTGWIAPLFGPATMLATGLLLPLLVDRAAVRQGLVPGWWMRLRVPLSIGLAIETIAVACLA